jgi:hypothetical protein
MSAKPSPKPITPDLVLKAVAAGARSPTAVAKTLGFKSGSSSVIRRLMAAVPDLTTRLKPNANGHRAKPAAKPKGGKWPVHPQNPFGRPSSSYHVCFNVLAAHPAGLPRERLIALVAKATGKDERHAGFDVQVVCSARKNDEGLDAYQGPRNRSCKYGFYVERTNGHVKLVLPAAAKERP